MSGDYIPKTVFQTRYGHYDFLVMSFILTNLKWSLNLMNRVFRSYQDLFVIVFINDILVYSINEADHMNSLRVVLQFIKDNHLFAKYNKYVFLLR